VIGLSSRKQEHARQYQQVQQDFDGAYGHAPRKKLIKSNASTIDNTRKQTTNPNTNTMVSSIFRNLKSRERDLKSRERELKEAGFRAREIQRENYRQMMKEQEAAKEREWTFFAREMERQREKECMRRNNEMDMNMNMNMNMNRPRSQGGNLLLPDMNLAEERRKLERLLAAQDRDREAAISTAAVV